MRRLLQACALLLLIPTAATAANQPHPVFDAAASSVAGKPLTVWCEMDGAEWDRQLNEAGRQGWQAFGFTYPDTPVVYMSPLVCSRNNT